MCKISVGGIPNSRNVLLLQIFLKRAAKPSAGTFSGTLLNLTWLHQSLPAQTFSGNLVKSGLALHQSLPELLRNLLPNPVEPDWVYESTPKPSRPSPEASEPSPEPC